MSSCGNEVSKWSLRRIAEPLEPVDLPNYTNRFSLEKPISGIDECLHIPGKADSAYSSFSGGSNIPECPIPSCYNKGDSLPLEQLPYMNSGYIRGIYNPIAINSDFSQMHDNKIMETSRHSKLDSASYSGPYGSTPAHEMLYQPQSPVARLLSPLPHQPSSPPQTDCYNISRNVEQTHSGIHSVHREQYTYKDLPFGSPASCYDDDWLPRCKNESPVAEEHDIWYAANRYTPKKSNSPIVTKPCLMFQEFLTSGLAKTQKILCTQNSVHTYKIPEEINSKSSPSLHVSYNAVNDTQENKQCFYACSVHKPPFTEAELPSTKAVPGKPKEQLHPVLHLLEVNDHSCLDPNRCESCLSLKCTDSSLPNEAVLGIINSYEDRNTCFSSEGETSREVWQSLLKQQTRMQKPLPHGLDVGETPHCEVYDAANTISYYKPPENSASQMLNGFRKAKQNDNNHSPDLLMNPRQEEMLKPIYFPEQKISKKALGQSQDDSARIKINRKTTPLLYYLSGGKNTSVMSHRNATQEQEDFALKSSRSNHPVSAEPIEIPRDNNSCVNDTTNKNEGLILGSPASSVDEKFKNDYREKLKVAQRKVLRETSFKRKDLQMSLPIRLKQKPFSRPSIQHLRSLSLSSTNEDSKLISPPKPLETINKEEESKRPQTIRIGGRKRATKEQKKFSYSEPEKLNQLDDQRDQGISWTKQNARSRSDEINEEDTRIIRNKALENQDRALSKAELKQIQHNALLEYMERKIGQRPATAQSSTQQKNALQSRPSSTKKISEDNLASNLATSRKLQHTDGFCQFPAPGRILEHLTFPSALTSTAAATSIPGASSPASEMANSKGQPSVSEENWASQNALAKSLLHSGASFSSKSQGRSKSAPLPLQDIYQSTACPAFSTQDHENYHMYFSSASKENMEVGPSDQKDSLGPAKQSSHTAGRRGTSMDETGTSEIIRLSPLSQSTDQLHHLKSWHICSGLETGKNSQGRKHCNILQNCESELGHLSTQSHPEGIAEPRELHLTVQALSQPHSTQKLSSTLFSVDNPLPCCAPPLSMGKYPNVPLELFHSSPASSPETDNDVFKDSFTSGSEMASHLPSIYRQNKSSTPDRITPELALTGSTLQASTEKEQIKEEHNTSIHFLEIEDCNLRNRHGESGEEKNSSAHSHCLKMVPELPIFFSEERSSKDFQLKKEISEQSRTSNASKRTQQQQLEANDTINSLDNWTYCFTSQRGNQGGNSNSEPLVNATTLQNEHDNRFPVQDTTLSIAQSKSPEDQRCEDLAAEIVAKDKSLVDILMPHPIRKTALDLMEGLFPASISMLNKSCRKKGRISKNDQRSRDGATDPSQETNIYLGQRAEDAMFHINRVLRKNLDDPDSITSKKKELISSINLKLQTLWDERELIQSEVTEHAVHGKELESMVQELCKPNEYERYMMFIGDLEKVVNLLLCLSSRLARVQNAMEKTDENTDAEEKQSLNERHRLLSRQQEDAKDLKENLDRRERVVSGILSKYITESQLQDFRHFVQAKISLLIEQKYLEEQIKFLEEQLERLENSIPP
ncbi:protein Shroom1 [Tiliqua scincoides]|uniref:protein Shroom1 n=1 Tax=Tiliqua scincoides TaxID=71010 RepID=UPI003462F316